MPESKAESISSRRRKRQIDVDRDANDANPEAKLTPMKVCALEIIKADASLYTKNCRQNPCFVFNGTLNADSKNHIEHKEQTRGKWAILK